MKPFLRNILLNIADFIAKAERFAKKTITNSYKPLLSGIFAFCIVFGVIYITVSRNLAIKHIKKNISQSISYLNELGLDISYSNIKFNAMMFYPLVKIENLKLYNVTGLNDWSIDFNTVKAFPNLIGTKKIRFTSVNGGTFTFNEFSSEMDSEETFLDITTTDSKFDELVFHAENINIKDFAKIEKIAFLLQANKPSDIASIISPSYTTIFEANDVKINGLIDYPLSSTLKLIYAKSNIMGNLYPDEFVLTSLEKWLLNGGYIDVPNIIIQWEPLTLVGRGNINFNADFSPRILFVS